jgi:hypothetical protein
MRYWLLWILALVSLLVSPPALAATTDEDLLRKVEALEKRVRELEAERKPAEVSPAAATPEAAQGDEPPSPVEEAEQQPPSPVEEAEQQIRRGVRAPVIYRRSMNDQQSAAARAGDYTLDPDYRGFIPVPNTAVMIKFNARPRVDLVGDSADPGTDFRFVPAKFPADENNGWRMSANANASQLIVDVRAPAVQGTPRFYYRNDFFGSNSSHMNYRLQHLYGEFFDVLAGFTFGVFEDPDAWPDTVDYEGTNSVIFARRAVAQYRTELFEGWELTLSLEDPDIYVDTTGDPNPNVNQRSRAPDGGFAVRWAREGVGHVRFASIFRSIGTDGGDFDNDDVFGWGVNTSGSLALPWQNTMQFWFVYGEGVGGMGNDTSFVNSDAAFNASGDLRALEYWSTMIALTHEWNPQWRSTATHGYVYLENTALQAGDTYHETHYASVNLMYQIFKRMRIGIEGLYGWKELNDGRTTDDFRVQLGLAWALFD